MTERRSEDELQTREQMLAGLANEPRIVAGATIGGEWTKKRKGTAKIYTHPNAFDGRAVVENHWGISFNGQMFTSVDDAKQAALAYRVVSA